MAKSQLTLEVERLIETIVAERKRLRERRLALSARTASEIAAIRRERQP